MKFLKIILKLNTDSKYRQPSREIIRLVASVGQFVGFNDLMQQHQLHMSKDNRIDHGLLILTCRFLGA